MSQRTSLRRGAEALLALAVLVMPDSHKSWAHDMRSELDHIATDTAAVRWAVGCVTASIDQRIATMLKLNGQVSRPVLMLEWLMCFGPLTLLWFAAVRYAVLYHASADMLIAILAGALGPIALLMALLSTITQTHSRFRRVMVGLSVAFAIMTILRLIDAGGRARLDLSWFKLEWSLVVLISLLPLLGCLHLVHLSRAAVKSA